MARTVRGRGRSWGALEWWKWATALCASTTRVRKEEGLKRKEQTSQKEKRKSQRSVNSAPAVSLHQKHCVFPFDFFCRDNCRRNVEHWRCRGKRGRPIEMDAPINCLRDAAIAVTNAVVLIFEAYKRHNAHGRYWRI